MTEENAITIYNSKDLDQREPHPGLFCQSCERMVTGAPRLRNQTRAGIWVGAMIAGGWHSSTARHAHTFRTADRPTLITMDAPEECIEYPLGPGRLAMSGIFVSVDFLDEAAQQDPSGSFKALRGLIREGFCRHDLSRADRIFSSLIALKNNPYRGTLADLYAEQQAMAVLLDLAGQASQTSAADPRPRLRALADEARDMIAAAPGDYRSVSDMAQQLGTNTTSLRRAFQDAFGQPIFEFVCERRMGLAQDLLRGTEMQIAQIAYRVGYRSPSNFTAAYRRKFGHSPANDRRRAHRA